MSDNMIHHIGQYQGRQFGNYRLLNLLGEGGFSEVYRGEHIHLGTTAAVKILTRRLTHDEIELFRNEARTSIQLEHPHIVRVYEFDFEANLPFIVMSYAPNGSLRQRHATGVPVPLPIVLSYVNQIAEALQYAHDRRLMHLDVKPDNMLIGSTNNILLSDFGLASLAHATQSIKTQKIASGTISYMAPEQLQKRPRPASDQYALGIAVYEWLCGECPFQGEDIAIYYQHVHVTPTPLRAKVPALLPNVEQVVLKALAKIPEQRFPTVRDFATALNQASSTRILPPLGTPFPNRPLSPSPAPNGRVFSAVAPLPGRGTSNAGFPAGAVSPLVVQAPSTKTGSPALRQGVIFGLTLGIAVVMLGLLRNAFNFSTLSDILVGLFLYLVIPLVAGLRASLQTGKQRTGVGAGVWTALFGAIIISIYTVIAVLLSLSTIIDTEQTTNPTVSASTITTWVLIILVIVIGVNVLLLTLCGLVGGALGGSIGRRRVNTPPINIRPR